MEVKQSSTPLLHEIPNPAFVVSGGTVSDANAAARQHGICTGTAIASLLALGQTEYTELAGGRLYLTLNFSGALCGASVTRGPDCDLFILEQEDDVAELQAMALAAQALRTPLANVMTVAEHLFPMSEMNGSRDQAAHINKGLYQMQRIISNMSDAYRYSQETAPRLEIRDIRGFLEELFEKNIPLIQHTGVSLTFANLPGRLYCLIDSEKLERAVGNILSNALKFTPKGSTITASLVRRDRMLYLTVQDSGAGIPDHLQGNAYNHFLRHPGVEDGRFGIGLGMVLIRSAAAAHGGTVLMDQPQGKGMRITMTIAIRQDRENAVRSPILLVDYAGGRDHQLLELSDHLPPELYSDL